MEFSEDACFDLQILTFFYYCDKNTHTNHEIYHLNHFQVFSSVVLSTFMLLCTHSPKLFLLTKLTLCTHSTLTPILFSQALAATMLLPVSMSLTIGDTSYKRNHTKFVFL